MTFLTVSWKSVPYAKDMSVISPISVALDATILIWSAVGHNFWSTGFFVQNYGLSGCAICVFGSREVWRIQVQILGSTRDSDAMDFKKSAQDESNIIAVAVSLHFRDPRDQFTETVTTEYNSRSSSDHSTLFRKPE